ncbi:MAG: VWA domain-containing protein [Pyrinomonadaceae bacterium]
MSVKRKFMRKLGPAKFIAVLALAFAAACIIGCGLVFAAKSQNRPRRSAVESARPSPTPTPVPTTVRPQVNRPAAPPTQTPTPGTRSVPIDRIAPQLGEPPPAPILKPKPTPTPPEEDIDEGSIVRVNTELVTLNVRVIDRNNRPIDNVRQSDFHVFEDGVSQPIESFTREEVPISYGLAIDNSGSLRGQLQSVIDAGKTIINSNKRGDETFIIRFIDSGNIDLKQDFTSNKDILIDTLDEFYTEGGQTAIIDAVYLAAEHTAEYKKGDDSDRRRRALIVVTDGEDRHSIYSQQQLFARLREEDVQIYVIGFVNELDKEGNLIRKSSKDKAVDLLNKLATETGGRAFFPQSLSEVPQIAGEIVRDLRTQYVLAYNPTNKARDGSFRSIKVAVDEGSNRDKRIALTRNGRVAPKGEIRPATIPTTRKTTKPLPALTSRPD